MFFEILEKDKKMTFRGQKMAYFTPLYVAGVGKKTSFYKKVENGGSKIFALSVLRAPPWLCAKKLFQLVIVFRF